jgi:hypothetical protein
VKGRVRIIDEDTDKDKDKDKNKNVDEEGTCAQ